MEIQITIVPVFVPISTNLLLCSALHKVELFVSLAPGCDYYFFFLNSNSQEISTRMYRIPRGLWEHVQSASFVALIRATVLKFLCKPLCLPAIFVSPCFIL